MADNFSSGLAFRDFIANAVPVLGQTAQSVVSGFAPSAGNVIAGRATQGYAPGGAEFLRGALGLGHPTVTIPYDSIPLRAAPAPKAAAVKSAPTAKAAAAPAPKGAAAAVSPDAATAAALGKLSFRQLMALGDVVDKTTPRGTAARPVPASDAAGNLYLQLMGNRFQQAMERAKDNPDLQDKLTQGFAEKVALPLALKGNTANEYIYGNMGQ